MKNTTPPTADEQRFIDEITADPDASDVPLVFADWLDEHGQADRAELIRAELRLRKLEGSEWQQLNARVGKLRKRCSAVFSAGVRKKFDLHWERGLVYAQVHSDARLTAADLRDLARFPCLTELRGFETLGPDQLARLSQCPNVKSLRLYHRGDLTPEQWEALATLSHVERLSLNYDQAGLGDGLSYIATMHGLKELDLEYRSVGDIEVAQLAALTGLEALNLGRADVGDDGLMFLPSLKRLRALVLHHTKITDATLQRLVSLPLTALDIGDTEVKEPLACVLRFPRLQKVGLRRFAQITDANLPDLLGLPDLREVDLRLTRVTRFRLAPFLARTKWKKVRLEVRMGYEYESEEREVAAFREFCKERDVLVDVEWE
jgi:uncharacterized protein (TIGR02996 family)